MFMFIGLNSESVVLVLLCSQSDPSNMFCISFDMAAEPIWSKQLSWHFSSQWYQVRNPVQTVSTLPTRKRLLHITMLPDLAVPLDISQTIQQFTVWTLQLWTLCAFLYCFRLHAPSELIENNFYFDYPVYLSPILLFQRVWISRKLRTKSSVHNLFTVTMKILWSDFATPLTRVKEQEWNRNGHSYFTMHQVNGTIDLLKPLHRPLGYIITCTLNKHTPNLYILLMEHIKYCYFTIYHKILCSCQRNSASLRWWFMHNVGFSEMKQKFFSALFGFPSQKSMCKVEESEFADKKEARTRVDVKLS